MIAHIQVKILEIMQRENRGRENATTREQMRQRLSHFGTDVDDRKMREAYATLPICSSDTGLFIPVTTEEVEAYDRYLRAKMPDALRTIKIHRIYATWPALVRQPKETQKELFG